MENQSTSYIRPKVVIVGCFQNGKSTLVNCLLDDRMARTGDGQKTTPFNTIYSYGEYNELSFEFETGWSDPQPGADGRAPIDLYFSNGFDLDGVRSAHIKAWKPILDSIDLMDTPGFNADETDDETAKNGLDQANYVIVVVNNKGLSDIEERIITEISRRGLQFAIVMNCTFTNKWHPKSKVNAEIAESISMRLSNLGFKPNSIDQVARTSGSQEGIVWPCNLLWFWMASGHYESDPDRTPEDRLADKELVRAEFLKRGLRPEAVNPLSLAEESNVIPLRRFLKTYPWRNISNFQGRLTEAIVNASNVWQKGLQAAILKT
jgi:signal recognition particle receptor subunit beta